ncbi:MAG: DUF1611 domain-containing protein [bacterium]|nr:DUF1611 domain-containing protein [bacterium]
MQLNIKRIVILAEGCLTILHGKTAIGVLRYRGQDVVAVIDSTHAGEDIRQLVLTSYQVPIVKNLDEAMQYEPDSLLIGFAPIGGFLPETYRHVVLDAINRGLHIVSGLHYMLGDDPEFAEAAKKAGVKIYDVRKPEPDNYVARGLAKNLKANTVLFIGSDCACGKMTAALECHLEAKKRGYKSEFLATGQTGIMIANGGIPLDRVIADFMAGEIEKILLKYPSDTDFIFIEGQGSILHPGYSGVTLALMHGSMPKTMILCHEAGRTEIDEYQGFPFPPFPELIQMHEQLLKYIRPSKVVGIALNTKWMSEAEALKEIARLEQETGLPTTDPVRFGASKLIDTLEKYL